MVRVLKGCVQGYSAPTSQGAAQLVYCASDSAATAAAAGETSCNAQALAVQVRLPALQDVYPPV